MRVIISGVGANLVFLIIVGLVISALILAFFIFDKTKPLFSTSK